jgi:cardiolipin synthase A/B
MLIAVPAFRLSCKVGIDRGRAWSVVDELMLWAAAVKPRSIAQLATESNLERQLVVASIARMMRFRLIELTVRNNSATFQASAYGREVVESGCPLPFFPKRDLIRYFASERSHRQADGPPFLRATGSHVEKPTNCRSCGGGLRSAGV